MYVCVGMLCVCVCVCGGGGGRHAHCKENKPKQDSKILECLASANFKYFLLYAYSRIFPNREKLIEGALELAATIASKSPVAVQGTKVSMVYSRDHTVQEGLDHIVSLCVCMCVCVCVRWPGLSRVVAGMGLMVLNSALLLLAT